MRASQISKFLSSSLKTLFFVFSFVGFVGAEDIFPRFASGLKISYSPPNAKVWKLLTSQEEDQRGLVLYNRETLIDDNGVRAEPALSIVYKEAPTGIKNLFEFVAYSKATLSYKITNLSDLPNGVMVLSCIYQENGIDHSLTIGHLFEEGLGVQIICDTTVSLLKAVEEDQRAFLRSVSLTKK